MNDRLKDAEAVREKKEVERLKTRQALVVAAIAATAALVGSLGTAAFNYIFTERPRTDISREMKELQSAAVQVTQAAQKTSDNVAAIDAARLDMQRQLAAIEEIRVKIQQQVAAIDQARFELQRETGLLQARNDTRRTSLEELTRTHERVVQANNLKNEVTPKFEVNCQLGEFRESAGEWICSVTNRGTQTFSSEVLDLSLGDKSTNDLIPDAISTVNDSGLNSVPPGVTVKHFTRFKLGPSANTVKQRMFMFTFQIKTNQGSVDRIKQLTRGVLSGAEIDKTSVYTYTYRLW